MQTVLAVAIKAELVIPNHEVTSMPFGPEAIEGFKQIDYFWQGFL
jgi:hypothetical protein